MKQNLFLILVVFSVVKTNAEETTSSDVIMESSDVKKVEKLDYKGFLKDLRDCIDKHPESTVPMSSVEQSVKILVAQQLNPPLDPEYIILSLATLPENTTVNEVKRRF